jgi:hypothetical protein
MGMKETQNIYLLYVPNKLISMNSESELHSFQRARTPQTQGSHPLSDYYGARLEGLIILSCQRSLLIHHYGRLNE